jgi:hypothetical protein
MNTENIKQTSRAKYLHSLAILSTKENHEAQMLYTAHGGTFRVSMELISFLAVEGLGDNPIIFDIFESPVQVDRKKMLEECIKIYKRVTASWLASVMEINRQR